MAITHLDIGFLININFEAHFNAYDFQARGEAMATAAHYRKLAEECFEWAHEARDVTVRQHYAKLCQIWLECADRAELRSGVITPPEPTIQKVA